MRIRSGDHRNRYPIDHRYKYYNWPELLIVKCPRCRKEVPFQAEAAINATTKKVPIPNEINGKGACTHCAYTFNKILWPEDAFFQIEVTQGLVWAWNEQFLDILSAKISKTPVTDAEFDEQHPLALYYLARLPKHALLNANKVKLLKKIQEFKSHA